MNKIIDTHCHYNLDPLVSDWKNHWSKAQKNGVGKSIIVGTNVKTSQKAVEIAITDSNLYATVGIHPGDKGNISMSNISLKEKISSIEELIISDSKDKKQKRKIVALGEIGLDYYRLPKKKNRDEIIANQKRLFIAQLELAQKHSLPVVLHIRDRKEPVKPETGNAYWDAIDILEEHYDYKNAKCPAGKKTKPFVMHCVSGSLSYAIHALDMGAYFGFDGNITYPNSEHLREILSLTPFNRIIIETDAPYLPPQDHRGETCEPWMIIETASYIADKFQISLDELSENSHKLFDLD